MSKPFSALIDRLVPVAKRMLDSDGAGTVETLRDLAYYDGIISWGQYNDHQTMSCLGQVFRKAGAVNSGFKNPSSIPESKGVLQVIWVWPSPYKGEV